MLLELENSLSLLSIYVTFLSRSRIIASIIKFNP
jgi:hypothetical protein